MKKYSAIVFMFALCSVLLIGCGEITNNVSAKNAGYNYKVDYFVCFSDNANIQTPKDLSELEKIAQLHFIYYAADYSISGEADTHSAEFVTLFALNGHRIIRLIMTEDGREEEKMLYTDEVLLIGRHEVLHDGSVVSSNFLSGPQKRSYKYCFYFITKL